MDVSSLRSNKPIQTREKERERVRENESRKIAVTHIENEKGRKRKIWKRDLYPNFCSMEENNFLRQEESEWNLDQSAEE